MVIPFYGTEWKILNADAETFEVIWWKFAKDKYSPFYENKRIVADPNTFEVLSHSPVNHNDEYIFFENNEVIDIDFKTFQIFYLKDYLEYRYARDVNNVYYLYYNRGDKEWDDHQYIKVIDGADPSTFEIMRENVYARDKNNFYFNGNKTDNADPNKFLEWKEMDWNNIMFLNFWNSIDPKNLYYNGNLIQWYDFRTFEVLEGGRYSKDKNGVYHNWSKLDIDWIDPESFELILSGFFTNYSKDKNSVYHNWIKIEVDGVDSYTFKFILSRMGATYFKDKNNVYYSSERTWFNKIEWADPETFVFSEDSDSEKYWLYSQDKNYKYCLEYAGDTTWRIIKLNWTEFWELDNLGWLYTKDEKTVYYNCAEIKWADAKSFQLMEYDYTKDKNNVYYNVYYKNRDCDRNNECIIKVKWADPETFSSFEEWWKKYWKDKYSVYFEGERIN